MTEVGNVYGESLYELAKEEGLTKLIGDQLAVLQLSFRQEPDFIRLLSSPNLTKTERCQIEFGGVIRKKGSREIGFPLRVYYTLVF